MNIATAYGYGYSQLVSYMAKKLGEDFNLVLHYLIFRFQQNVFAVMCIILSINLSKQLATCIGALQLASSYTLMMMFSTKIYSVCSQLAMMSQTHNYALSNQIVIQPASQLVKFACYYTSTLAEVLAVQVSHRRLATSQQYGKKLKLLFTVR